jgi:Ser/Thr protein kinase RdoA (MazF antagonist)
VDALNPALPRRDDDFDVAAAAAIRTVLEVSTPEVGDVVAEVSRRVGDVVRALGQAREVFGLIHGDLHQWNYLFHQGAAGAIDFDDCGYGHWLYDLAVTLNVLERDQPHYPALRQSLLAGYRQTRALSAEHENYLNTFMALRSLQNVLASFEERNHPAFRETWQAHVAGELRRLQAFVRE